MFTSYFKMGTCIHICLLLILLSTNVKCDTKQQIECSKIPSKFSEIILSLTSLLTNEMNDNENFIISPLSISAALAMLFVGARGTTKTQISTALQYNLEDNKCPDLTILEGFRNLFISLETESDAMSLNIVNCIFIQQGLTVSSDYVFKLRQYFNSEVNYLDFLNEEELSMQSINQWVSDKTNSQIKKLLNEPLDTMTLMILANIVYFKGLWEHSFRDTWDSFFHTMNGTKKIVPFMKLEENFNYYQDEETNNLFLELPYAGGNVSMLLVLPKNRREVPNFQLTPESFCNIMRKLRMQNVAVGLPRVQLSYRRELSQDMRKLGMTKVFSDRADLSGIREQNDLHVSLMIHKAVIDIDEKGSRASAISGVGVDSRRRPTHDAIFWANHPFMFYIIDKQTEAILFVGRVMEP